MRTILKTCVRNIFGLGFVVMIMFAAGCSDDDNNRPTSIVSTGSITSGSGGSATGNVNAPAGVTLTLANSVLSDGSTPPAPVVGSISTSVRKSETISDLPVAAQTLPTDRQLALFIDITMGAVKTIAPPMVAVVDVPSGVTSVDVYSFNGTTWVLEQANVAVVGGKATFNISHLSIWGCFTKTSATVDTTPDAFSFTPQTGVAVSTLVTSNAITVAGINSAAPISITGGSYSIGTGAFTSAAGTVTNGQTVRVQHTSSATNGTAVNTILTIGGVSATFTSTTVAAGGVDTTPDAFSFTAQTGVALSTLVTSNAITVAGINSAAPISITGGSYSIGTGAFTSAAGTVTNGQTVRVQHTSSATNGTAVSTILTIGGVSATFTSTTVAGGGVNAAALYQASCAGCHSLGTVDTSGSPNLLGKNASTRYTAGVPSHFNNLSLTAEQIAALTAYFAAP